MKDNSQNFNTNNNTCSDNITLEDNGWKECASTLDIIEQLNHQGDYRGVCLSASHFIEAIRRDIHNATGCSDAYDSIDNLIENICEQHVPRKIKTEFENLQNFASYHNEEDIVYKKRDGKTCLMATREISKFLLTIKLPEVKKVVDSTTPNNNEKASNKKENKQSYFKKSLKRLLPSSILAAITYYLVYKMGDKKDDKTEHQ